MILVAPAAVKRLATNFAPIGALGLSFLSCLANPKYGITTVILFADALLLHQSLKEVLEDCLLVER